jgi:hypothetical protein
MLCSSNYAPEELYGDHDLEAIERRFQIIHAHDGVAEYKPRHLVDQPPPLRPVCYDIDAGIKRGQNSARDSNAGGEVWAPHLDHDLDALFTAEELEDLPMTPPGSDRFGQWRHS